MKGVTKRRRTGLSTYRRLKLPKVKSVYRIDVDDRGTHGWNVSVFWDRKWHTKFFSDSTYGGSEVEALLAAIVYRDRLERKLKKPRSDRRVVMTSKGIVRRKKGNIEVFEITWWPEENVVKRTSVSIAKWGEEVALQKAKKLRRKYWLESLKQNRELKLPKTAGRKS